MVRKHSDLVSLLSSRGSRGRGRSGLSSFVARLQQLVFGRSASARRENRSNSAQQLAMPVLLATAAVAIVFTAGYFTGSRFGGARPGEAADPARQPLRAGVVGELDTRPLSAEGLLVAAYEGVPAAEALPMARNLTEYLQAKGFQKARPYEYHTPEGSLWTVLVYSLGPTDRSQLRERLRQLPAGLPDPYANKLREMPASNGNSWPFDVKIQ